MRRRAGWSDGQFRVAQLPAAVRTQHRVFLEHPRVARQPGPSYVRRLRPRTTLPVPVRLHRGRLLPVVYWGVYAGIRRIPTSGFF